MNSLKPYYYDNGVYQVWDIVDAFGLDFYIGNVLKYVIRAGHKDPYREIEDLEKAKAYIDKKIEILLDKQVTKDES